MNILIYFPYNQRTVEQQSVMEMFVKNGHTVYLLTLSPVGQLHTIVTQFGVNAFSSNVGENITIKSVYKNVRFLITFCKQYKIDVVFAHQQICVLPLLFAKYFIKAKTFYTRHNTDEDYANNPTKAKWLNKIVNAGSKKIIAPSNIVYNFLQKTDGVSPKKLLRINYGYNFEQYEKPNNLVASTIRQQYSAELLIISVARLVPAKRHIKMFTIIKQLINDGLDCKFICLSTGIMQNELQQWIDNNKMSNHISLLGVKKNVLDYLATADVLLHLSQTEASNSVVKEAGLVKKAAILCKGVGDFEDYIQHKKNGFLVDKENPELEAISILKEMYTNKQLLLQLGNNAYLTITNTFDIKNVEQQYLQLLNDNKR